MCYEKSSKAAVHVFSRCSLPQPQSQSPSLSPPSSPRAVGERSGWQAGWLGWLTVCAPSPSVSHKIINLAMFSRTFECGFRLETRLRARIPRNVRKRVQPYLRRAAVCLHPSDSGTRTRKASLVT